MPVSGWWEPIVICVVVMPGAEAVSGVLPPPPDLPPVLLLDELQAAAARLTVTSPAMAAILAGCDLIMFFLSPCGLPPASADATRSVRLPRCSSLGRTPAAGPDRSGARSRPRYRAGRPE